MPQPAPRCARRGAARALPLLLLVLLLCLGGLWWALSGSGQAPGAQRAALPGAEREAGVQGTPIDEDLGGTAATAPDGPGAAGRAGAAASGVRLRGDGRLTGLVTERESGAAVAGATVELLTLPPVGQRFLGRFLRLSGLGDEFARRGEPAAVTTSDALGRFEFRGVRRGSYHLDARGPAHAMEATATARVLDSGEGGPVELFMRPAGAIAGRVLRPDGSPAPRARVVLEPGPGSFLASAQSGWLRLVETRADERGAFAIEGLPPADHYEVSAWSPGHAIAHALDVPVAVGLRTEVTVTLRAGGTLEGRVLAEPAGGAEGEPQPIAGAHVGAVPRGLRHLRMIEEVLLATHTVTDEQGRYRMHSVPEGDIDVMAFSPEWLPARGGPVTVLEGLPSAADDIVLAAGPMVSGRVVDGDGRPVPGVLVRWDLVDWRRLEVDFTLAPLLHQALEGFAYPTTDLEGRFRAGAFAGRAPYRMDFVKGGYASRSYRWDPASGEQELEVVLARGGAIEGVVMDLERAEPVTSFTVFAPRRVELSQDAPGRFNFFSGGETFESPLGRFLLSPVEAGSAELIVSAPGYVSTTVEGVAVAEGETTRGVIVALVRGGVVRGEVVDPDGRPAPGARVLALHDDGPVRRGGAGRDEARRRARAGGVPPLPPAVLGYAANLGFLDDRSARTDGAGRFELVGVEPGRLRIVALHPDWCAGASGVLELEGDSPLSDVRVELESGGGLVGTVLDRHGRPLEGALVIVAAPARFAGDASTPAGGLYSGRTGASGAYRIERMTPGSYVVVLARGDEALDLATVLGRLDLDVVTVPQGEPVRHDIVDQAAGACRVHGVVSDAGRPLTRGRVTALYLEADNVLGVDFKVARVNADGSYEFEGLAPGEHLFRVEGAGVPVSRVVEVPDLPEERIDLFAHEGVVAGRVLEERTGEPVPGARVVVRSAERSRGTGLLGAFLARDGFALRATADRDGAFEVRRVPPGRHELLVEVPGPARERLGAPEARTLELREGERRSDLTLHLPSALGLEGRVLDSEGRPVGGARVRALRADGSDLRPQGARAEPDGSFRIGGLAAGTYLLLASAAGHADGRLEGARVEPGGVPVEVVLPRGVEVVLRVRRPDGSPVAGARGRLTRRDAGPEAALEAERAVEDLFGADSASDGSGRVELGRHAPGSYELSVWRGLSRTSVPDVELRPDETLRTLDVVLP